jgi:hypothetical protein
MAAAGFEPAIPEIELLQTHALGRAVAGIRLFLKSGLKLRGTFRYEKDKTCITK